MSAGLHVQLELPSPEDEVIPGVRWGRAEDVLSPAFWAVRSRADDAPRHGYIVQNGTLVEEVGFCLLGGFGVTAELATAYFVKLRERGLFDPHRGLAEDEIRELLYEPVDLNGRAARYRFPVQRAARLAAAIPLIHEQAFHDADAPTLRARLLQLDGIGPKTASWIVRNWLGCDSVAILDIHVIRACQFFGLFPRTVRLPAQYDDLETRFIAFAQGLDVPASILDAVIWSDMRSFSPSLLRTLT